MLHLKMIVFVLVACFQLPMFSVSGLPTHFYSQYSSTQQSSYPMTSLQQASYRTSNYVGHVSPFGHNQVSLLSVSYPESSYSQSSGYAPLSFHQVNPYNTFPTSAPAFHDSLQLSAHSSDDLYNADETVPNNLQHGVTDSRIRDSSSFSNQIETARQSRTTVSEQPFSSQLTYQSTPSPQLLQLNLPPRQPRNQSRVSSESYVPSNRQWPFVEGGSHLVPSVPLAAELYLTDNAPHFLDHQSETDAIREVERVRQPTFLPPHLQYSTPKPRISITERISTGSLFSEALISLPVPMTPSSLPSLLSTVQPTSTRKSNFIHFITSTTTSTTPYFSEDDLKDIAKTFSELERHLPLSSADSTNTSRLPTLDENQLMMTDLNTSHLIRPLEQQKQEERTRVSTQNATIAAENELVQIQSSLNDSGSPEASKALSAEIRITVEPLVRTIAQPKTTSSEGVEEGIPFGYLEEGFVLKGGVLPFFETENVPLVETTPTTAKPKSMREKMEEYERLQLALQQINNPVIWPELGDGATPHLPNGIFAYCYPFSNDEIVTKCGEAVRSVNATGIYVPMMMEIQLKHDAQWYAKIKELKLRSKLDIVGIAYEKPDWDLITNILMENKGIFAGVMIEWIGPNACLQNVDPPTMNHMHLMELSTTKQILRYFVRETDFKACETENPIFLSPNFNISGTLPFPKMIDPVFSCFAGQEGLCYKVFNRYPVQACSSAQRFSFNPYEQVGGRMMHLVNETCHGLPPHDLYGVL